MSTSQTRSKRLRAALLSVALVGAIATTGVAGSPPAQAATGGSVWSWGGNRWGQLGDGTTTDRSAPVTVKGITDVTQVVSGGTASVYALRADGTVWAWGANWSGQLGDGTSVNRATPVQVKGPTKVTAIVATMFSAWAVTSDGYVWTWGSNAGGELGDGTYTDRLTPVRLSSISGVTAFWAIEGCSFAKKTDGTLWAWGDGSQGCLGNGSLSRTATPTMTNVPAGVVKVVGVSSYGRVYSVHSDGRVAQWGNGSATPAFLTGFANVTDLQTDNASTWALRSDGTVLAYGSNRYGQLGDGTTDDRPNSADAVAVTNLSGVTALASGQFFRPSVWALKSDGTVWAWGDNGNGQLGDETTIERHTPVQAKSLTGVKAISVIQATSCGSHDFGPSDLCAVYGPSAFAVVSDGSVWAWGANEFGQLGDGTKTFRTAPVKVKNVAYAASLAGQYNNMYAITATLAPGTPTISGTPRVGSTLTAAPGTWAPAPVTLAYQWLRDGKPIAGATGTTYQLVAADVDHKITVQVTGSKTAYTPASATSAAVTVLVPATVTRLSGADRVETAIKISVEGWTEGTSPWVVLANGTKFPDAMAGGPLAYSLNAPILLTMNRSTGLETSVAKEMGRLGVKRVIILGSTDSVSAKIEKALTDRFGKANVERIGGTNRYATAIMIADRLIEQAAKPPTTLFLTNGENFPDALAASPIAAMTTSPIIFTPPRGGLSDWVLAWMATRPMPYLNTVYVLGSKASVPDAAATTMANYYAPTVRLGGTDRYDTAVIINEAFASSFYQNAAATPSSATGKPSAITVATGTNFPDALAGGVLAAKRQAPLFLVNGATTAVNTTVETAITGWPHYDTYVFGGTASVSNLALCLHIT